MRTRLIFLITTGLALSHGPGISQELPVGVDHNFSALSINPVFAGDADAIVRFSSKVFRVDGPGSAKLTVREVVTVMNPEGRDDAQIRINYDRRILPLRDLEGRLLDAKGNKIRDLKKDDQDDYGASGSALFDDSRIRQASLPYDEFPYTVDFEWELEFKGIVNWPKWAPQSSGIPVEFARFVIDAPAEMQIRYAADRMDEQPDISNAGNRRQLTWTLTNLTAFEQEPLGPTLWEQVPMLHTAPAEFEIEGTSGRMRTWTEFGRWYHEINRDRSGLPADAKSDIEALVDVVEDPHERARLVYAYLQDNTRYVSVQLGIGGWQTYSASYVHERRYGDCKALTNYTMALLREAGVTAYPALIRNGYFARDIMTEFSCNQFNHVVLMVPSEADTLWLECTSQTIPFGHIGGSNEGRTALVVTPDGSTLVRTPRSGPIQNAQVRKARIQLGGDGKAIADVVTEYSGNQRARVVGGLSTATHREREDWLQSAVDIPNFEVLHADFSSVDRSDEVVSLPLTMRLRRYGSITGSRIFFQPNLMERWVDVPPEVNDRKQPAVYAYAWADSDSLTWILPEGTSVESMPELVELETSFGYYKAEIRAFKNDEFLYVRNFELRQSIVPAEEYDELRSFLAAVRKADRAKVVLVR